MTDMVDLDDVMSMEQGDPGRMMAAIESFPEQCAEALRLGKDLQDLPSGEGLNRIAFVGMGGSAIGGDILATLLGEVAGLQMSVHRGYRLPSLLDRDTLVVAVSYSGNTEETLSALEDARYLGCRILVITSGGKLLELARGYRFPYIVVPEGLQPRAALGYLSLGPAAVLEKMGLLQGFVKVVYDAIDYLKEKRDSWSRIAPTERNFSKQLAKRLFGKTPVIYGTDGIMATASYRWKCQFNENSKLPAFCHTLPEMDHNEIVGWHELDDFSRNCELIFLTEEDDSSRLYKRVKVTSEILGDKVGGVIVIHVGGKTRTEKMLSAISLGDYTSGYLALLKGVDPTPVERIALLKQRMADEGEEEGDQPS